MAWQGQEQTLGLPLAHRLLFLMAPMLQRIKKTWESAKIFVACCCLFNHFLLLQALYELMFSLVPIAYLCWKCVTAVRLPNHMVILSILTLWWLCKTSAWSGCSRLSQPRAPQKAQSIAQVISVCFTVLSLWTLKYLFLNNCLDFDDHKLMISRLSCLHLCKESVH